MGLFLKNPETCMNPWRAVTVLVVVCVLVLLSLLAGKHRFESNARARDISRRVAVLSAGFTPNNTNPVDGRFRF